jgi:DNA (cytosine-5)-methyltransferase 1
MFSMGVSPVQLTGFRKGLAAIAVSAALFGLLPNEITVDCFAGGGGASTGIELATGRPVDIAINHDLDAIKMHEINHPTTRHYQEDIRDVDPVVVCGGNIVGAIWFSPDCKHFTKARGCTPVNKQIRGLAWTVIRWTASVPIRTLYLENVSEFQGWCPTITVIKKGELVEIPDPERKGETFRAFVECLTTGLSRDTAPDIIEEIKSEVKGVPLERLYQGLGYNVDYRDMLACEHGAHTSRNRFYMVARNDGGEIRFPAVTHGHGNGMKNKMLATDIIDWSKPGQSIFDPKRPRKIVQKSMKRFALGFKKFVIQSPTPYIVPQHIVNSWPVPSDYSNECADLLHEHGILSSPAEKNIKPDLSNAKALSWLVKYRNSNIGSSLTQPVPTITAGGKHLGVVTAFIVKYYGSGGGSSLHEPLHTVTAKHRFGLVTIFGDQYRVIDIQLRMLNSSELFAAMGFPANYQITHDQDGNKISEMKRIARAGNAVVPLMAKLLIEVNLSEQIQPAIAA